MRERVMKWLQIKRYNWKNYDIFLIAVVLILTFISSYVISIVNSDISLKRQLVGVVMGIAIIGIFSIIDYHDLCMYIPITGFSKVPHTLTFVFNFVFSLFPTIGPKLSPIILLLPTQINIKLVKLFFKLNLYNLLPKFATNCSFAIPFRPP